MKSIKVFRYILIAIIAILLTAYGFLSFNNYMLRHLDSTTMDLKDENIISFSVEPGIYDHSITIELKNKLKLIGDMTILYTFNGDDPYFNNSFINEYKEEIAYSPMSYTEPIKIDVKENDVVVVPIKAVIFYQHHYSRVVEKTYIVSDGDINQYTDLPIVSITVNNHDLYDYYDGIMIKGYLGDKFIEEGREGINWGNIAEERQVSSNVTMFKLNDNYKNYYKNSFRVAGGTSKVSDNKSFIIENTRDKYYNIFDNELKNGFTTLKLRSGSQDYFLSDIRSSIVSRISREIGFDGAPYSRRAILYINGNFYSIIDILDSNSSENIRDKYNLPSKKIEETINLCNSTIDVDDEDFEEFIYINYDLDNLLKYTAIEIFINNTDWPLNNIKRWRYVGGQKTNSVYGDGKWRFIINDVDITWWNGEGHFDGIYEDTLESIINKEYRGDCDFYNKLINNQKLRSLLVKEFERLFDSMYTDNRIYAIIDDEYNKIEASQEFYLYNSRDILKNVTSIKEKVSYRKKEIYNVLEKYYNN